MNRILIVIGLLLALTYSLQGQTNSDFETWNVQEREEPFNWSEPENWTSTNSLTEFINPGITKTSDAYEGNSAALISTIQTFGVNTVGTLVLGKCKIDYKNQTVNLNGSGIPLDQKLTSISAWYKYENNLNIGSGKVEIIVNRWSTSDSSRIILAYHKIDLPTTSEYKNIDVQLDLEDFLPQMDSVTIIFYSDGDIAQGQGKLTIDNIQFEFVSNTNNVISAVNYKIYPNPISKDGFISIDSDITPIAVKLYDVNGKLVFIETEQTNHITLNSKIHSGLYILEIETEFSRSKSKIIITE